MKRFLNRLRLAATAADFPEAATAVGLAAFAHADRELVARFAAGEFGDIVAEASIRAIELGPESSWAALKSAVDMLLTAWPRSPPLLKEAARFVKLWRDARVHG